MSSNEKNPNNRAPKSASPRGNVRKAASGGARSATVRSTRLQSKGRCVTRPKDGLAQVTHSRSKAPVRGEMRKRTPLGRKRRTAKVFVGLVVLLVLILVSAYQLLTDGHQIESKLLFLRSEHKHANSVLRPLAKEIERLKNYVPRSYVASSLFDAVHGSYGRLDSSLAASRSVVLRDGLACFSDCRKFKQWLSESFRAIGIVSNDAAKVR